jgi:hypothetical protein
MAASLVNGGGSFCYAATTSPAGCNWPGFLSDTESEPSMKRVTMTQKTMFMFCIEKWGFRPRLSENPHSQYEK